jgi:hypothetical protein
MATPTSTQTVVPAAHAEPTAMQVRLPGSQQSGAMHAVPVGQQPAPVVPHVPQIPLLQIESGPEQALPFATQVPALVSQHPPVHWLPAQQIPPDVPQDLQAPLTQTDDPAQLLPLGTHVSDVVSQHPPWLHIPPLQHD